MRNTAFGPFKRECLKLDELSQMIQTMHTCADKAGELLRKRFRVPLHIETKADASPVTEADRAVEHDVRQLISTAHPTHSILGEELGSTEINAEWQWVIDPIDGTRAFITGRPSFTTLIAVMHNGSPFAGLIDQPVTSERWLGVRGRPSAFFSGTFPGQIGTRKDKKDIRDCELSCTAPDMHNSAALQRFDNLRRHVGRTSWGGDAYAYGLLALGHIDIIAESDMKLWDWAALVPIIEGAGGRITDWNGHPLSVSHNGTVLACGNDAVLSQAVKALQV